MLRYDSYRTLQFQHQKLRVAKHSKTFHGGGDYRLTAPKCLERRFKSANLSSLKSTWGAKKQPSSRSLRVGERARHATVALIAEHLKLISERQERHTLLRSGIPDMFP